MSWLRFVRFASLVPYKCLSTTLNLKHWELEYLVQYTHGDHEVSRKSV